MNILGCITGTILFSTTMLAGSSKIASTVYKSYPRQVKQIASGSMAAAATILLSNAQLSSTLTTVVIVSAPIIGSFTGHQTTRIKIFEKHPQLIDDADFTVETLKWAMVGCVAGGVVATMGTLFHPMIGSFFGAATSSMISSIGTAWEGGLIEINLEGKNNAASHPELP